MAEETTRTYSNGDVTVNWEAHKCIHSTKCWKGLIAVFNPKAKPWVNLDGASADAIRNQVRQCPSGALSLGEN